MMEAENAGAGKGPENAPLGIDQMLIMSQKLRPSPPVYMLSQVKEHRQWACDHFVLCVARKKYGVFTSTSFVTVGNLHQCQPEDFVYVHESLGVLACLRHMVVHRCGASWRQVRNWVDLPNNGSSMRCRRILVGGRSETNWCCAFSRQRLPEADALEMTMTPVENSLDLAVKVYGSKVGADQQQRKVHVSAGGRATAQKRSFEDTFHLGVKRSALLKQTIDAMVEALETPSKRAKYNSIVRQRSGKCEILGMETPTPGIRFLLRVRLLRLCQRLLEELKGDKIDMNSLVFIALRVIVEGPQFGEDVIAPRLPVRALNPLPVETVLKMAFDIPIRNYSKTSKRIRLIIGNPQFTRHMGWCSKLEKDVKCRESRSSSLASLSIAPSFSVPACAPSSSSLPCE